MKVYEFGAEYSYDDFIVVDDPLCLSLMKGLRS